ncbi:MAG: hypothetical protein CM1200mP20_14120 [Pseudomonadota bacterium]|nr:MAG: hypothetical protein CM1200mP20_14120 [Pseudomonadota bacterium]
MNIRPRPERGAVWRIAPPLTVSTDEIDRAITILDQALVEGMNELCDKPVTRHFRSPDAETGSQENTAIRVTAKPEIYAAVSRSR